MLSSLIRAFKFQRAKRELLMKHGKMLMTSPQLGMISFEPSEKYYEELEKLKKNLH